MSFSYALNCYKNKWGQLLTVEIIGTMYCIHYTHPYLKAQGHMNSLLSQMSRSQLEFTSNQILDCHSLMHWINIKRTGLSFWKHEYKIFEVKVTFTMYYLKGQGHVNSLQYSRSTVQHIRWPLQQYINSI